MLFTIGVLFVAAGVLIAVGKHNKFGWLAAAFFGFVAVVEGWLVVRPATLVITRSTIEVKTLGRKYTRDLASCGRFRVWEGLSARQAMVVFDHPQDIAMKGARMSHALSGHSGALPETFGMKAADLAELLNRARDAAQERATGTSAIAPTSEPPTR